MNGKLAASVSALALASCATAAHPPAPPPAAGGSGEVLIAAMNRAVDPCADFPEFASGAWRAANPLPASLPRWGPRDLSRAANRRQLQVLLEELSARRDWPAGSPEQQVGDYHASCMDEAGVEAKGLTPLAPLLAVIDGVNSQADLQRALRRLHELAIPVGFVLAGSMDNREPARLIANLSAGSLGLADRDAYLKPEPRYAEARARYRTHVARVLELGGMPAGNASPAAEAVLALEQHLAEASLDGAAAADPAATEHKLTLVQLEQLAPAIDWRGYFNEARLPLGDLNVAEPKLVQQLGRELVATPLATWKSYLTFQLLDSASPWLPRAFAQESFDFKEHDLVGAAAIGPRAQRCVESAEALLGEPLGRKYAERHFPPAAKAKVQGLIQALLVVLREEVAGLEWMSKATKQKALEKLATYNPQVGYPDQWKDWSGVVIRRDALWANVAAARRFNVDDNRQQVGKPTARDLWQLPASSAGAYLDLQLNQIVLPAGFLQPPAFDLGATDAVNQGSIGASIAHDLTHSIDAGGAELDALGRPRNWWSDEDRAQFEKRGQCVSDQFEGYFIEPGVHFQGKRVLSESIGDLAGAHLAWLALERSIESHPAPLLEGLTPEQQFFIALGQARGESVRLETQRQLVKTDPHPVSKFRLIGALSNLPEFQSAFACKAGAAMVRPPEKRCKVW